jgi:hypothetical protein
MTSPTSTHHCNLDAHVAQSGDATCPVPFDQAAPLELEAKFGEEINGGVDVFYDDADVVHALDCHVAPWRSTLSRLARLAFARAVPVQLNQKRGGTGLRDQLQVTNSPLRATSETFDR